MTQLMEQENMYKSKYLKKIERNKTDKPAETIIYRTANAPVADWWARSSDGQRQAQFASSEQYSAGRQSLAQRLGQPAGGTWLAG